MSKYTTEVRYICENASGLMNSKGFSDVDEIIAESIDKIFSFDFPVFDDTYRSVLCTKILRHYYTREIGFETVGLWKLKLQTKLNEVMPYYNQLYKSELLKFNPLYDVDLHTTNIGGKEGESNKTLASSTEEETTKESNKSALSTNNSSHEESGSNTRTGNSIEDENRAGNALADGYSTGLSNTKSSGESDVDETGKSNKMGVKSNNYAENQGGTNYDLYSDTPQGALTDVDQEEYLTNARKITDAKNKSGKSDDTEIGNDEYTKNVDNHESNNSENNTISASNERNRYDENNQKTSVNTESTSNTVNIGNKTDSVNLEQGADTGTSKRNESGVSLDKYNSTESYVVHVVGKQAGASYSKLLKEFRDTFLNIDLEVINSLSDLFMNIW